MTTRSIFLASIFTLALPACGGQTDQPATDDASLSDDGKADRTGGGSSYYVVRPDLRRCAAPGCGGSFIKRVNFSTTTCADGSTAGECYMAAVDYSKTLLDDNDMAALANKLVIVKGSIVKQKYAQGTFGNLNVSEVWVAAVGEHQATEYATFSGTVYRVKDNGVRCIAAPCPSDHETKINGTTARDIAGVDLQSVGATDDQISDAYANMTVADGILVAGTNTTVTGPGGTMFQLTATNFFAKAVHQDATGGDQPQACGGFAGFTCPDPTQWCDPAPTNACGAADLMGTCKVTYLLCAQVYVPVCGCDGQTYSNDCERVRAKVQKAHDGACAAN
jgi:uncharacterized protein DUF6748/Kazal-type serine protease inhibitor-like protein